MKAIGMKITNFHYSNTAFDKGEYVEYPKWVHIEGQPSVIVESAEAEAKLLAQNTKRIQGTIKINA